MEESAKLKRHRAETLTKEGDENRRKENFDKAIELYSQALAGDNTFYRAHIGLALVYSDLCDYVQSVRVLTEAIRLIPDSATLEDHLGDQYRYSGDLAAAKAHYEAALRIDPEFGTSYSGLAEVALAQGNVNEAENLVGQALAKNPSGKYNIGVRGKVLEAQGKIKEAIRCFEQAEWNYSVERLSKKIKEEDSWNILPTIREMVEYLDRYVCGQRSAKLALSTAIYNHYISNAWQAEDILNSDLGRQNILILGPSGIGKTYMVELLAKKFKIPFLIESATSLVQTGYVGKKIDSIMEDLLTTANYDVTQAELGIVFIDEIDKVRTQGGKNEVSGEGVQNGLLTMLEGRKYQIETTQGLKRIDSRKVLFICAGAFDGIANIAKTRLLPSSIGFGAALNSKKDVTKEYMLSVTVDDLEKFGIIPQFAGRFSAFAILNELSREELRAILATIEDSVLKKKQELFRLHGIKLTFDEHAIEAILDKVNAARTGARGLRNAINTALQAFGCQLDQLMSKKISAIDISAQCIFDGAEPAMETALAEEWNPPAKRLRENAFAKRD